jgi:hypothetical protein
LASSLQEHGPQLVGVAGFVGLPNVVLKTHRHTPLDGGE